MDLDQFSVDRVEARSVTLTDVDIDADGLRFSGYAALFGSRRTSETSRRRSAAARSARSSPRAGTSRCTGTTTRVSRRWRRPGRGRCGCLRTRRPAGRGGPRRGPLHDADAAEHDPPRRRDRHELRVRRRSRESRSSRSATGALTASLTNFKNLLDVSPTWNPAYEGTSAELRSALAEIRSAYTATTGVYADPREQRGHGQRIDAGEEPQRVEGAPADDSEVLDEQEERSAADPAVAAQRGRGLRLLGIHLPG
jgi:hypothetical protein